MTRTALLAAASMFALCAGGAFAAALPVASHSGKINSFHVLKAAKLLYNQNSNNANYAVDSQNFSGDFTNYDDQAADDFVVPKGQKWIIKEIDVTGAYFNGYGPASSEDVIFYNDSNSMPGLPVKKGAFKNLVGGNSPNFEIKLPGKGLQLRAGRYWISVIANLDYDPGGEWGWQSNSAQHGNPAMWQNLNGGLGVCQTWDAIEDCVGSPAPDLMFELRGTSKRE